MNDQKNRSISLTVIVIAAFTIILGALSKIQDMAKIPTATLVVFIALTVIAYVVFEILIHRWKERFLGWIKKYFEKTKKKNDKELEQSIRVGFWIVLVTAALLYPAIQGYAWLDERLATPTPIPTNTATATQTLTATPTFTNTATATFTPTFTPTPLSAKSRYYMIVLDASRNMDVPFGDGTQTKWDAALASVKDMLKALNDYANFGLVVVGGQGEDFAESPCDAPQAPLVPFVSPDGNLLPNTGFPKQGILSQLDQLKPSGGGAFDEAFIVAKNQLENLPPNTIKMLIYITGASDTCDSEDEWEKLTTIIHLTDDLRAYREIIVLMEKIEPDVIAFADNIKQLSPNTNVHAPQNQQELDESVTVALEQVEVQAQEQANAIASAQPPPLTSSTPTTMRTFGPSPTPTSSRTATPTRTKTPVTPTTPAPPPPPVCSETLSIISPSNNQALGCSSGQECIITVSVQWVADTQTNSRNVSVWVKPLPGDSSQDYFAQLSPVYVGNCIWNATAYIGQIGDPNGMLFNIEALITYETYGAGYRSNSLPGALDQSGISVTR